MLVIRGAYIRGGLIFGILRYSLFNFSQNGENVNYDPLKNHKKSKFQKPPHNDIVSPQNVSPKQISASMDL